MRIARTPRPPAEGSRAFEIREEKEAKGKKRRLCFQKALSFRPSNKERETALFRAPNPPEGRPEVAGKETENRERLLERRQKPPVKEEDFFRAKNRPPETQRSLSRRESCDTTRLITMGRSLAKRTFPVMSPRGVDPGPMPIMATSMPAAFISARIPPTSCSGK